MRVHERKVYKPRRLHLERDFKQLYRFKNENVEWLSEHFIGENGETRGGALSSEDKMKIFLRYVADPGFQVGVGEDIGVHQSTISRTVNFVASKISEKSHLWIKFPEDINHAKTKWRRRFSFPSAIGALDFMHVRITKPHVHGDEYINRKGFPSINIQATCDSDEWFSSVDIQWPGSVHDSRVWRNSAVCEVMHRTSNAVLLADEGYGVAPWLMTPYRQPNAPHELAYNQLLTTERCTIERCFGQLKRRFPNGIRVSLERIPKLILSCFVLHNISKYLKDEDEFDDDDDINEEHEDDDDGDNDYNDPDVVRDRGRRKRDEIAHLIYNNMQ